MATIQTLYLGDLRTEITHVQSGNRVITDAPTDNNGKGEYISPTDMVAAGSGKLYADPDGDSRSSARNRPEGKRVWRSRKSWPPNRAASPRSGSISTCRAITATKTRKSCKARPKPVPSANRSIPTSGRRSPGITAVRNNGAGKIRRRPSRASFTATCATKPECGLFLFDCK